MTGVPMRDACGGSGPLTAVMYQESAAARSRTLTIGLPGARAVMPCREPAGAPASIYILFGKSAAPIDVLTENR